MSTKKEQKKFEEQTVLFSIVSSGDGEKFNEFHIIASIEGVGVAPVGKSVAWNDVPDALESLKLELHEAFMKFQVEAAAKAAKRKKKKLRKPAVKPVETPKKSDGDDKADEDGAGEVQDEVEVDEETKGKADTSDAPKADEDGDPDTKEDTEAADGQDDASQQISFLDDVEI